MYAVDGQVNMTYNYFPQTDIPSAKAAEGKARMGASGAQAVGAFAATIDAHRPHLYLGTTAHTSGRNPYGLNALWGMAT